MRRLSIASSTPLMLLCAVILFAPTTSARIIPRLHQGQWLHAHNSYHRCVPESILALATTPVAQPIVEQLGGSAAFNGWAYSHRSLPELLENGVRSVELDVYWDPTGGRYLYRAGPAMAKILGAMNSTDIRGPDELATPGWKVFHITDLDFEASCYSFTSCLSQIKTWVDAHPDSGPIFIRVEPKASDLASKLPPKMLDLVNSVLANNVNITGGPSAMTTVPEPAAEQLVALEGEILSVFNRSALITPDDFRATRASLRARVDRDRQPTLKSLRGKVFFVLVSTPFIHLYRAMHPDARGALLFWEPYIDESVQATNGTWRAVRDDPATLFLQMDGPLSGGSGLPQDASRDEQFLAFDARCKELVQLGFLLRVPCDTDTREARANDTSPRDAVIACGAHFLHTDFPAQWTLQDTDCNAALTSPSNYSVNLLSAHPKVEALYMACNPVTSSPLCKRPPSGKKALRAQCTCQQLV